ncbi:MAG TPA: DarT ssDNA thymidine ADP-ribosyltransferase family protein [Candidatus Lumbricidophila sp.]|nr:DarT ssDNA thymidine ADP-ribosyltransferase family protein [Candidatus Lumbricidophila sp.]
MAECIHGFDEAMCAICTPPKVVERPAPPRTVPRSRTPIRGTVDRSSSASSPGLKRRVDVAKLRVMHVTHRDNLDSILAGGVLAADLAGASPVIDIASAAAREFRRTSALGDGVLADYVPFLLSVEAQFWAALRANSHDPRLSAAALAAAPADFVLLLSDVATIAPVGASIVAATDADPARGGARRADGWAEVELMLQRLASEDGGLGLEAAELLVHGEVRIDQISMIAVANEPVRDAVRAELTRAGTQTRVAVYPPWFQTPELG